MFTDEPGAGSGSPDARGQKLSSGNGDCTCTPPEPGDGKFRCDKCGHVFRVGQHFE